MSNGNGHHWSKFSWRDWTNDKALHSCSLSARAFWLELLAIMHEGAPTGHLTINGRQATLRQMAANANCTEKEATKALAELDDAGVFSRTDEGTIFCRRMVRDAAASEVGREHAEKRWGANRPNGPPNGGPSGEPTRKPNGQAYGDPNAKNLELESEKEPPRSPPVTGGVARRERKPRFKNGFLQIIADEGMPSLDQPAENVTPINRFVALANVRRRVAN